jgi:hypothetical protein
VPRRPNSHVSVDVTWRGDEVQQRAHRAMGRGTIAIGEAVVTFATQYAHVISGDLRRSIHAAKVGSLG